MTVHDARSTRYETSRRVRDAERDREELIDHEVADLARLLDRVDGLTHEVRRRLRRIEHHRGGVSPEWTSRNM